ncbi:MAG: hypothetical protein ACOCVT_01795 [bacterium]
MSDKVLIFSACAFSWVQKMIIVAIDDISRIQCFLVHIKNFCPKIVFPVRPQLRIAGILPAHVFFGRNANPARNLLSGPRLCTAGRMPAIHG